MTSNRANAQHSTGPKDTTLTRFNSIQHGLTGKQNVIPGESQEEYDNCARGFRIHLSPQNAIENTLADRIIAAAWRLKRFQRIEAAFFNERINAYLKIYPGASPDIALANLFVDPVEIAKTRLFLRYQTSVEREYDKATTEFRKARAESELQQLQQAVLEAAYHNPIP